MSSFSIIQVLTRRREERKPGRESRIPVWLCFTSGREEVVHLWRVSGESLQVCGYFELLFSRLLRDHRRTLLTACRRRSSSLTGLPSTILAIGGRQGQHRALRTCEQYFVKPNRWKKLPTLNEGRYQSGCCLVFSLRAFCFCGKQELPIRSNSIETLDLKSETAWKLVFLN